MKKFLINLTIFFLGFFILDKALILLRDHSPETEIDKRLEHIITGKIDAKILIFGSSRGARDLLAFQIADSLKTTAYNLSFPGSGIEFHDFLLDQTLKNGNKKPEIVILVVDDPTELLPNSLIHFRLDRLYPLVKYPAIREKLVEKDGKNSLLSELFIVHQMGISNFDIRQKHFKAIDTLLPDGSMPISFKDTRFDGKYGENVSHYKRNDEIPQNTKNFVHFIDLCNQNNIPLIITLPPNCYKSTIGFQERVTELAGDKAYIMKSDSTNAYYRDGNYYFDDVHLKRNGAIIFTNEMIDYIKSNKLLFKHL